MSADQTSRPQDVVDALDIARKMIAAGIPVFAAPPCPGATCVRKGHQGGKFQYDLPPKWQLTIPAPVWLERWRPGWALAAVGGHVADFLDEDPRNGGSESMQELKLAGQMSRVFGVQATPSGGFHYVISPLRERETNAFMPGLDYQGGLPDGKGRAFIWIAPTVRRAKVAPYEDVAYRWLQDPDLDYLLDFDTDDSIEGLRDRILSRKERKDRDEPERERLEERPFTEREARDFCRITLDRVQTADIGEIENAANGAACQLSHFVPDFWTEEFAYSVLHSALGQTAYDPDHPAASWTAEKFHDVLAGVNGRAPGDWEAVRRPESVTEVIPEQSAVDALLAEMLSPEQVAALPPPRPLVAGLLNLDSESWLIGEPGTRKSFVALDIAAHVAEGVPWQKLPTTQGHVVIVVAEGAGGSGARVKAWKIKHGRKMSDRIYMLPRPVQARDLGAWAVLVEACRRLEPVLVIADTQARVTVGLEENSATDMGIYIEAVRAIREATGACVLTVHHTGRKGGDARGSSAIDGAQSTELKVTARGLTGELLTEKQKDMEMMAPLPIMFEPVELGELDANGKMMTSLVMVSPDAAIFQTASGVGRDTDPAGAVRISEPGEWTRRLLPEDSAHAPVARQLLQTLLEQGGEIEGLTQGDYRKNVSERWYAERPANAGRSRKGVDAQTWARAWTAVEQVEVSGERVMVDGRGQKKIFNPALRAAYQVVTGR